MNKNLFSVRLFFYRLNKIFNNNNEKPWKLRCACFIIFLALTYGILNERYAWKLILEQECFPSRRRPTSNASSSSSSCLARTWERYTHSLSETNAKLLHIHKQTNCKKVQRLGHWIKDGGWNICLDDIIADLTFQEEQQQITSKRQRQRKRIKQRQRKAGQQQQQTAAAHPCIIYSFGINDDPSFDLDLIRRYPYCTIYAFDPSIDRETGDTFLGPNIHFYNIGLGGGRGDDGRESNSDTPTTYFDKKRGWEMMTLDSIMDMLHHDHVTLVKMDIEGSEWDTFASWEKSGVYEKIGQLVGEIHFSKDDEKNANANGLVDNKTVTSSLAREQHLRQVKILEMIHETFGFDVFYRQDNFRWTKLMNVHPSELDQLSFVRTYRCIELGWKKRA